MNPLRVAVIVKNTPMAFEREGRNMGMWSYPVKEFTWDFFAPPKHSVLDTSAYRRMGYDLIFHEDSNWSTYKHGAIPTVFYSIDSTLSDFSHYAPRYHQARQADLVLVDHDRLERFQFPGRHTRRLLYCVNDKVFWSNRVKSLDINFHCGGSDRRIAFRGYLSQFCNENNWKYGSGVIPLPAYAKALSESKIVVNVPRNVYNRPHRIYDALASKACLLSMPFPKIDEETFMYGYHYMLFSDVEDLPKKLKYLFDGDRWIKIAEQGYTMIMQRHTWSVRANELRTLIHEELGL